MSCQSSQSCSIQNNIGVISSKFINKFVQKCLCYYTSLDQSIPLVTVTSKVSLLTEQLWEQSLLFSQHTLLYTWHYLVVLFMDSISYLWRINLELWYFVRIKSIRSSQKSWMVEIARWKCPLHELLLRYARRYKLVCVSLKPWSIIKAHPNWCQRADKRTIPLSSCKSKISGF